MTIGEKDKVIQAHLREIELLSDQVRKLRPRCNELEMLNEEL